MRTPLRQPPQAYSIGQEINWAAPWVEINLRVELPFWLMTDNATLSIEVNGHIFPVLISGETFELHGGDEVSDSKRNAVYQGPLKKKEELAQGIQDALRENPAINILWRKCKTVLLITSRCNEDVLNLYSSVKQGNESKRPAFRQSLSFYLEELCRAHIPVVNKLIQAYRLATYDYFPFEVAPWDVPVWYIQRGNQSNWFLLVPYRGWDHRPMMQELDTKPNFYKLIETQELQDATLMNFTKGELELLDALNFMERGDYSGAVRRVATAIEVVVGASVAREIEKSESEAAVVKFLDSTRMNFPARIKKYEMLSGRPFVLDSELKELRNMRNRIVHGGYRISAGERGYAQKHVDVGRWIFNWFEDDDQRRKVREGQIGFRSLGRDITTGVFRSELTSDGVVVSPPIMPSKFPAV